MRLPSVLFTILASVAAPLSAADDIVESARATLASSHDAVVTVRCVLKIKSATNQGGHGDQEQKLEACATTIDPSGLFVASAESLDPESQMRAIEAQNRRVQLKLDASVTGLTVLLGDGTELPADIVLTDRDLDLTFLRLHEKPSAPLPAVTLGHPETVAALDSIYVLARAPKMANRTPELALGTISCVVKGPQPYYYVEGPLAGHRGCMAYTADGKPLGLEVVRAVNVTEGEGGGVLDGVIRPLDEISDLAKQALTAPAKPPSAAVPTGLFEPPK